VKIRPVGAEIFHADRKTKGQTSWKTDMTKLIVIFSQFLNAPKKNPEDFSMKAAGIHTYNSRFEGYMAIYILYVTMYSTITYGNLSR